MAIGSGRPWDLCCSSERGGKLASKPVERTEQAQALSPAGEGKEDHRCCARHSDLGYVVKAEHAGPDHLASDMAGPVALPHFASSCLFAANGTHELYASLCDGHTSLVERNRAGIRGSRICRFVLDYLKPKLVLHGRLVQGARTVQLMAIEMFCS